jgi:hypothetical protein
MYATIGFNAQEGSQAYSIYQSAITHEAAFSRRSTTISQLDTGRDGKGKML